MGDRTQAASQCKQRIVVARKKQRADAHRSLVRLPKGNTLLPASKTMAGDFQVGATNFAAISRLRLVSIDAVVWGNITNCQGMLTRSEQPSG